MRTTLAPALQLTQPVKEWMDIQRRPSHVHLRADLFTVRSTLQMKWLIHRTKRLLNLIWWECHRQHARASLGVAWGYSHSKQAKGVPIGIRRWQRFLPLPNAAVMAIYYRFSSSRLLKYLSQSAVTQPLTHGSVEFLRE
jgi:hypothetical protein